MMRLKEPSLDYTWRHMGLGTVSIADIVNDMAPTLQRPPNDSRPVEALLSRGQPTVLPHSRPLSTTQDQIAKLLILKPLGDRVCFHLGIEQNVFALGVPEIL